MLKQRLRVVSDARRVLSSVYINLSNAVHPSTTTAQILLCRNPGDGPSLFYDFGEVSTGPRAPNEQLCSPRNDQIVYFVVTSVVSVRSFEILHKKKRTTLSFVSFSSLSCLPNLNQTHICLSAAIPCLHVKYHICQQESTFLLSVSCSLLVLFHCLVLAQGKQCIGNAICTVPFSSNS